MKLVSLTGASTVIHPTLGTVAVGADGAFEVSEALAAELLAFSSQWATEDTFMGDATDVAPIATLYDPTIAAEALAQLNADIATLKSGGTVSDPAPTSPVLVPSGWRPNRWHPDARTIALCSMTVRNDQDSLAKFWAALVALDDAQVTP